MAHTVVAPRAKFTRCPAAIGVGSPSLLFPALQSRSHIRGSNRTNRKKGKYKIMTMTTNTERTSPPASNNISSVKTAQPQRAAPSQTAIAQKAYQIWLSQGQQPGCEQKNWFEAERQLQRT
jgi:Protein of unknown function (DUF2934)